MFFVQGDARMSTLVSRSTTGATRYVPVSPGTGVAQGLSLHQPLTAQDRSLYQRLHAVAAPNDPALQRIATTVVEQALQRLPLSGADDWPQTPAQLPDWLLHQHDRTQQAFAAYRQARALGGSRRYFATRAHALLFIQRVAPTKLVDGAWLQGLPLLWRDGRLRGLLGIYLDELGHGQPAQNHVSLYRQLLAQHDIALPKDDALYTQGLVQLALGRAGADLVPEVAGFNLGYEQLPLHLLITTHELHELGIDPYYFNLHITVDNAASGHAHQAMAALFGLLPQLTDDRAMWARMGQGYRLNEVGMGSMQVIDGLDLGAAVTAMLQAKARFGHLAHSDRCRIKGRTINAWLESAASTADFLAVMQDTGWIRRHENPLNSRFWQLLAGEQPLMQGVFSPFEQTLLHDWIAGDWLDRKDAPRIRPFHRQPRLLDAPLAKARDNSHPVTAADADLLWVQEGLHARHDRAAKLDWLASFLHAPVHAQPAGLWATREYSRLLAQQPF